MSYSFISFVGSSTSSCLINFAFLAFLSLKAQDSLKGTWFWSSSFILSKFLHFTYPFSYSPKNTGMSSLIIPHYLATDMAVRPLSPVAIIVFTFAF